MFRAVLGPDDTAPGRAVLASPFLVFAVFVQRAAAELASMGHVPERTGLRQRVPLFDAPALRDFLADPARRLFLAELLASFTRVASGRYRVRAGGRTRTRRFSELDPVRLAGLLEAVPQAERPGVYRQARRRVTLPDRGVSRLRGRPRPQPGECRPAAACRPAAGRGAGPPRRHASHRAPGAPRFPLVPGRPRAGTGCHGTGHGGRRGGRPGSGRPGASSTMSPTGTSSPPATPGSRSPALPDDHRARVRPRRWAG